LFPGDPGQNTNPPTYISDPNKLISLLYDEYMAYGLYFKVSRQNNNLVPYIKAELKISGIKDPIYFTNTFNQHITDPRKAHVEIPFGPEDKVRTGKLFWSFDNKEFHKKGDHILTISLGSKKYGEPVGNPPEWNPSPLQIRIEIPDIIPKN
jgi:hypothetical protein